MSRAARIPVLIVSGFLGSGKTTLVRRLLEDAQARGERVAVVSHEFGALGIDEALLGGGEERFVELAGGGGVAIFKTGGTLVRISTEDAGFRRTFKSHEDDDSVPHFGVEPEDPPVVPVPVELFTLAAALSWPYSQLVNCGTMMMTSAMMMMRTARTFTCTPLPRSGAPSHP